MGKLLADNRRQTTSIVLAGMMKHKWLRDRLDELNPDWFVWEDLGFVLEALKAYAMQYQVARNSFKGWFQARYPESRGTSTGLTALALADYPVDEVEANRAFKKLLEYGQLDEVKKLSAELERKASQVGIQEAMYWFGHAMAQIPCTSDREARMMGELLHIESEFMRRMAMRQEHYFLTGEAFTEGVPTGWPQLDTAIGNLCPGRLVVIGARPGCCKSGTMLQWAINASKAGHKCLFVSLEMSEDELAQRLLACHSGLSLTDIIKGTLSRADFNRLCCAATEGSIPMADNIFVLEGKANSLGALKRIVPSYVEQGVKIVFVDYLQILEPDFLDRGQPRHVQIAALSRGLKQLAQEHSVCIVVGAQLSREVEARADPKPQLRDLRESGSIEQDSDQVLMLDRPDLRGDTDKKNCLDVFLRKNRHGPLIQVQVNAELECQRFGENPPLKMPQRHINYGR